MPALLRFRPGGLNQLIDPDLPGGELETHSSTCSHCQHVTEFPDLKRMMNYVDICRGCMRLKCLQPECLARGCRPWEKEAERQEMEYKLRSRVHMQGWKCY